MLLIGSEITNGTIQDRHAKLLSSLLSAKGIHVHSISIVGDGKEIEGEILRLSSVVDLLLVTGGLGPTSDDLTRYAVANAAGVPTKFSQDIWEGIRAMFGETEPPQSNRRQAEIPDGFEPIQNTCGTAPGFLGQIGEATLIAMPGPPRELETMTRLFLDGYLSERYPGEVGIATKGTAFLTPESLLEDTFSSIALSGESWKTRAEGHRIVFELASPGRSTEILSLMKERLGEVAIRSGETSAAELVSQALLEHRMKLVSAESCTGGLIGKMVTDLPGSSRFFWGGFITYADDAKRELLSVSTVERHGAVSRETVLEMAEGAIAGSPADVAVAVSGVAGPGGGTDEKPVGTVWAAVKVRGKPGAAWRFHFWGDRERVRLSTAVAAMLLVEAELNGVCIDNKPFLAYT